MKRVLLSFILLMLSLPIFADDFEPLIILNSIEVNKTSEEYGDELYIVVTKFGADGSNTQYTIPEYPITWPSEAIHQIKDVHVWQGIVPVGAKDEIIIELVEHDVPPYNVDDSIGSIRIKLSNKDGKLNTTWEQNWHETDKNKTEVVLQPNKGVSESYTFKGEGGDYNLKFTLQNNVVSNKG